MENSRCARAKPKYIRTHTFLNFHSPKQVTWFSPGSMGSAQNPRRRSEGLCETDHSRPHGNAWRSSRLRLFPLSTDIKTFQHFGRSVFECIGPHLNWKRLQKRKHEETIPRAALDETGRDKNDISCTARCGPIETGSQQT